MKCNTRGLCSVFLAVACLLPGARAQTPPSLSLQQAGAVVRLTIYGSAASPCRVQYATNLAATNAWLTLTNCTLLSGAFALTNAFAPGPVFYRAVIHVPSNLVWIPAGSFAMGSPTNELERSTNELLHTVNLTRGFYVAQYPVTQGEYLSLLVTNPSYFNTNNGFPADLRRPVEQVSWFDATNYCAKLTLRERAAGRIQADWVYRLPTEAEWEYACRAGTATAFSFGPSLLSGMANFNGQYEYLDGVGTSVNPSGIATNRTTPVDLFAPNAWGLYDMTGNAWEWCQDWFGNYPAGTVTDPQGPVSGTAKVFRGGALNVIGRWCRSAYRSGYDPSLAVNTVGFRVVLAYGP